MSGYGNSRHARREWDRNKVLRFQYEEAVKWYKEEGTTEAHEAVLLYWHKWAEYAKSCNPPTAPEKQH